MIGPDGQYMNFSGCGNTFNCNHPVVSRLILDSLRYWVSEMHVDGFRFDLASILTRGQDGTPLSDPPLIKSISEDPVLANTKMIAEAWDAAGLYQVGHFPEGSRWSEWNGKYRDNVRKFLKGTDNQSGAFAHAVCGSDDLYGGHRLPYNSINFVTAHDGFTLEDLVSYQQKHNEENGEENRDGGNDNESWNCGAEGPTSNHKVLDLRKRQKKNFLTALFLSLGTPMLLMGDEYGLTHQGNNNTWSQEHTNWFNWNELEKHKDFFRFCSELIHFRKKNPLLRRTDFLRTEDIIWHGRQHSQADWSEQNRFIAYTLKDHINGNDLYIAFNASFEETTVHLPPCPMHKNWYRIIDTNFESPHDFLDNPQQQHPIKHTYNMKDHSALVVQAF
jgi:isoamylase/glycogen operon protein